MSWRIGRLTDALTRSGGTMLITADHGNAEVMFDETTGQPHTAHTLNRVPAMLVNGPADATALADGRLADVAPTLLQVMGLTPPAEMTGRSLIRHARQARSAFSSGTMSASTRTVMSLSRSSAVGGASNPTFQICRL